MAYYKSENMMIKLMIYLKVKLSPLITPINKKIKFVKDPYKYIYNSLWEKCWGQNKIVLKLNSKYRVDDQRK